MIWSELFPLSSLRINGQQQQKSPEHPLSLFSCIKPSLNFPLLALRDWAEVTGMEVHRFWGRLKRADLSEQSRRNLHRNLELQGVFGWKNVDFDWLTTFKSFPCSLLIGCRPLFGFVPNLIGNQIGNDNQHSISWACKVLVWIKVGSGLYDSFLLLWDLWDFLDIFLNFLRWNDSTIPGRRAD